MFCGRPRKLMWLGTVYNLNLVRKISPNVNCNHHEFLSQGNFPLGRENHWLQWLGCSGHSVPSTSSQGHFCWESWKHSAFFHRSEVEILTVQWDTGQSQLLSGPKYMGRWHSSQSLSNKHTHASPHYFPDPYLWRSKRSLAKDITLRKDNWLPRAVYICVFLLTLWVLANTSMKQISF